LIFVAAVTGCGSKAAEDADDGPASEVAMDHAVDVAPSNRPPQFTLETADEAVLAFIDHGEKSRNSELLLDDQMARMGFGPSENDPRRRRLVQRKELMGSAIDLKKTTTQAGNLVGETTTVDQTGEGRYAIKFKTWKTEPEMEIELVGVPAEQAITPSPKRLPGVWKYSTTTTNGKMRRVAEWVDMAAYEDVMRVIQQAGKRVYDEYCRKTPPRARDAVAIAEAEYSPLAEARRAGK
jgi:hypothetical protein